MFSSQQDAALWFAGYSRHLLSRWCRSHAPFPFHIIPLLSTGENSHRRLESVFSKNMKCAFQAHTPFILISPRRIFGSHPLPVYACLHTPLLPHYTLVDVGSGQTCLQKHFSNLMSYPELPTVACIVCWGYVVKDNKEIYFVVFLSEGYWYHIILVLSVMGKCTRRWWNVIISVMNTNNNTMYSLSYTQLWRSVHL